MYKFFQGVDFDPNQYLHLLYCAYIRAKAGNEYTQIKEIPNDKKLIYKTFVEEIGDNIIKKM